MFDYGLVDIADEFVHETADRRRLLVMHGDQFDTVVRKVEWLSRLGDVGYNVLLGINHFFNRARLRLGYRYWSVSAYVKHRVKTATNAISAFEASVRRHALEKGCNGIVCGHIHTPLILEQDGITYYNTGDWVENCSALIEYQDGTLRIVRRPTSLEHEYASRQREVPRSQAPRWERTTSEAVLQT